MGWEPVCVLVVHPEQLLKLADQQQNNINTSINPTTPSTVQGSPNLNVPNQTTPYHTILQTAVSRGTRRLSLHKKRLNVGPPELCPKMHS